MSLHQPISHHKSSPNVEATSPPLRVYTLAGRFITLVSRTGVEQGAQRLPLWLHLTVLSALALITLYIARGLWGYDDAFIIYRYARNFSEGVGIVYNPGEAYLGSSSIGYTLLLAAMHKLLPGLDFLDLGSLVSALCFFATGAFLWLLGVQTRTPLAGALAALITIANPVYVEVWGGEMPLLLALALAAILAYSRGMGVLTGLLLGLAVLTRQDSLVLVAAITAHCLLTKRKLPLAGVVAFMAVTLPWTAYSWVFYGSPLPETLDAKIAQGKAGWTMFFSGSVAWLDARLGPGVSRPLALVLILVGVLTLLFQLRSKPVGPWCLLLAWSALFTIGYTVLRVSFYGWYALPAAVALGALIAWGAAGVVEAAASIVRRTTAFGQARSILPTGDSWPRFVSWGAACIVLWMLAFPLAGRVRYFADNFIATHRESDLYARVGQWLGERGGPAVSVAYLEVGEIGYYSQSRVIDLLGLVTPGASAHVPFWDYGWAIQRYQPDYYLASNRFDILLQNFQKESWFTGAYEKTTLFEDRPKNNPNIHEIIVYKRKQGTALPAPLRHIAVQRVSQQPVWLYAGASTGQRLGQTFTATEANVSAITLLIGKPSEATIGNLLLHLRRDPADSQDLREASAPLSEIVNNGWHTFRFNPLPDSAGKSYYFTLDVTADAPVGQPVVALWMATDDLYPDGARYEGAKAVAGDFCMRASVPDER